MEVLTDVDGCVFLMILYLHREREGEREIVREREREREREGEREITYWVESVTELWWKY